MAYNWTTAEHDVPYDVVMVSISGTNTDATDARSVNVEPTADISWPLQVTANGVFASGQCIGWPAKEAIERAEELGSMMGLRVVIVFEGRHIWREEWGTLAEDMWRN